MTAPAMAMIERPVVGFVVRGDFAVTRTLGEMRALIRRAIRDREFVWWVRAVVAKEAPDAIASRNYGDLAQAIRSYVEQHIQYVPDPHGVENLTPPQEHMRLLCQDPEGRLLGDCDDAATLSAAMGEALGMPATLTVQAFVRATNPFQHVFATLFPRGGPSVICDTTRDTRRLPPAPTREKTVRV